MEKKIECPHCSSKNCFESPLENSLNYLCMGCGLTSSSVLKIGSDIVARAEEKSPPLVVELKRLDNERKIVWFPSVISTNKGMLYPEGTVDKWVWTVSPVIKLDLEEKKQYPIPGRDGEFYETRIGIEASEHFAPDKFLNAMNQLGAVMAHKE